VCCFDDPSDLHYTRTVLGGWQVGVGAYVRVATCALYSGDEGALATKGWARIQS
jgi:hypothetical protein